MQAPFVLVNKKPQEDNEAWIEQANEHGEIFIDKYLHQECEFIRVVKPDWDGRGAK
jgi:hypothetical protein